MSHLRNKAARPEKGGLWAVFGGVFDPVHNGHLALANSIFTAKGFDGILFVPSYNPPHKAGHPAASFEDRVSMLNLATADSDRYLVDTIESEIEGPGYTLNMVRAVKKRYPGADFRFIIGADNINDIGNWYRPDDVFREIKIIAGARPGFRLKDPGKYPKDRMEFVDTELADVSSSLIRERIASGISTEELAVLVPAPVARYIMEKRVYQ
jgi:nicotinate-nucleotide adenylyltransferase